MKRFSQFAFVTGALGVILMLAAAQPALNITRQGNSVLISWAATNSTNAVLQQTALALSSLWTNVTTPPSSNNGAYFVLLSPTNQASFFRLLDASANVVDLPDDDFIDSNGDGIDGTIAKAIFVSPSGNDVLPGTMAQPVRTIAQGIQLAVAAGKDVYVATGVYTSGTVSLSNNVSIYGGYNPGDWSRSDTLAVILMVTNAMAVLAGDLTLTTTLDHLTITGGIATNPGASAYGVFAVASSDLRIRRCTIQAGNGASGLAGTNGLDAVTVDAQFYMNGGMGGSAFETNASCNSSWRGLGGSAGTNGFSTIGGAGGDGGTMDTDCSVLSLNLDARPGKTGFDAAVKTVTSGGGGAGGNTASSTPQAGQNGVIANGAPGLGGNGYQLLANFFYGRSGTAGVIGQHGGGGGGGGGSGGNDSGTDSYGAGGGGGGSGGLAARGGGGGGGAGGSSFGIFAIDSTIQLTDSSVILGSGANGGTGGTGGRGQSGGLGGTGGSADGESVAGGNGGRGGHGGHGGGGGGGQGGYSVGLALYNSNLTTNRATISGGVAGPGGHGGASAPNAPFGEQDGNAGEAGASGVLTNVLNLSLSAP